MDILEKIKQIKLSRLDDSSQPIDNIKSDCFECGATDMCYICKGEQYYYNIDMDIF